MSIKFEVAELQNWINKQLERTDEFAHEKFKSALRMALDHVLANKQETYRVTDFKEWINKLLESSHDAIDDTCKEGFCTTLEHVLMQSNRYKGYNDNYWIKTGFDEWVAAGKPDIPDMSKYMYGPTGQKFNRHYY